MHRGAPYATQRTAHHRKIHRPPRFGVFVGSLPSCEYRWQPQVAITTPCRAGKSGTCQDMRTAIAMTMALIEAVGVLEAETEEELLIAGAADGDRAAPVLA